VTGVLVYGFGPYQTYRVNVTERTVRSLPPRLHVHRRVFAVRFDRRMFERTLERLRPGIVIGLGQHPRARKLRLERRAHQRGKPRVARFVSLALPRTAGTTVTYDAGDYVCNFSMWVVQGWCAKHGGRFAFIHVPKDYPPARLAAYLGKCLTALRKDDAARSSRRGRDPSK
jgi:pyrrolidone-carboxylate peptidase